MPERSVILLSASPLRFTVERAPPDDRAPGCKVVRVSSEGVVITRRVGDDYDLAILAGKLTTPRHLRYVGMDELPGVNAQLFAAIPKEGDESRPGAEQELLFLGTVVRAKEVFVPRVSFQDQCLHHFQMILEGRLVEPIDQVLMGGGV